MTVTKFIEDLLSEASIDDRIPSGIFDVSNQEHMAILKEHAANKVDLEFANALMESLSGDLEEGNYPERQAYNSDGVLVTFPDEESKAAAIARGTHQDRAPLGADQPEDDSEDAEDGAGGSSTSNTGFGSEETPEDAEDFPEEEEEEEGEGIFGGDWVAPEDVVADKEEGGPANFLDMEFDDIDIRLRPHGEAPSHDVYHVYDVLEKIKNSQDNDEIPDLSFDAMVSTGELHPSILFALKQKWEYDKGGNWYDETNKLRAATDRKGQLDPSKSKDRDEMLMWLDDYLKKKKASAS